MHPLKLLYCFIDFTTHTYDIQNYARQHLKLVSDRMETRYADRLTTWATTRTTGALSCNLHEGEIAQTPILMGGPIQDSHSNK
jgi:hypothetical protein